MTTASQGAPASAGDPATRGRLFALTILIGVAGTSLYAVIRERKSPEVEISTPLADIRARLHAAHRTMDLESLRGACRSPDCRCAGAAALAGLDADAGNAVLALAKGAAACEPGVAFGGVVAEALVRAAEVEEGLVQAKARLARAPADPFALQAIALAQYREGALADAALSASKAEEAGRGEAATKLRGLVAYAAGDLEAARGIFRKLVAADAGDLDALFNLGVAAQQLGSYGEARKSYLKVLRIAPEHLDARQNLVLLTHSFGASEEARHHLEILRKLDPKSDRATALDATLRAPPSKPVQVLSLGIDVPGAPSAVPSGAPPEPVRDAGAR